MGRAAVKVREVPCRCYKEDNQWRQQVRQRTFRILITGLWKNNFSDNSEPKTFWNLKTWTLIYGLWWLNSQDDYAKSCHHFLLGSPGVSCWDRVLFVHKSLLSSAFRLLREDRPLLSGGGGKGSMRIVICLLCFLFFVFVFSLLCCVSLT